MRRSHSVGDLNRNVQELPRGVHRRNRTPFDKLHHKVVWPDIVKLADIVMVERRDGPRLSFKAFREGLFGKLNRNDTIEPVVARFIHFPHAARANRIQNFIRAETRPRREGHRSRILLQNDSRADRSATRRLRCWRDPKLSISVIFSLYKWARNGVVENSPLSAIIGRIVDVAELVP